MKKCGFGFDIIFFNVINNKHDQCVLITDFISEVYRRCNWYSPANFYSQMNPPTLHSMTS